MKKIALLIALTIIFLDSTASFLVSSTGPSIPERFSWRNINGIDFTTPVKNQEPCPSCEAYAIVAALETMAQYKVGYPFGCDLSEAHLFFCSGGTCKWGVNVSSAADYVINYGVPDEGCFPDPHRKTDSSCNSLSGWENRTIKIKEWGWVNNDMESIKKALIEHGPLVICIYVWEDFMHYRGGIYKHRWGGLKGGHLITLVGYDDSERYWLCKNSWGDRWGEKGWVKISYDANLFIKNCYGGTGILYLEGVYGNFMPDVPKIYIEKPKRYHTYIFGKEIPSIFGRIFVQIGTPRVVGFTYVETNVTNAEKVEFYVDGVLKEVDYESPFSFRLNEKIGLHTLEAFAYKGNNISKSVIDVFMI